MGVSLIGKYKPEGSVSCSLLTRIDRPEMVKRGEGRRVKSGPVAEVSLGNVKIGSVRVAIKE
jgi:hypothetical protein